MQRIKASDDMARSASCAIDTALIDAKGQRVGGAAQTSAADVGPAPGPGGLPGPRRVG